MNEFQIKHEMIAMEAMDQGLPITLGSPTFMKVKGIARAISDWAKETIRPDLRMVPVSYSGLRGEVEGANYADLADVKITVPRGLNGYLNAYVESLFEAFLVVENLQKDVLMPFSTWLSLRIASPESLADSSTVKDLKGYAEVPTSKAKAMIDKFVNPNSRSETALFKNAYPSVGVMKITWDNINSLSSRYLETNPTKVLKLVNEISGKIDRVIKIFEEQNDKMSAQTATVLSGICAQMAEAVDLYGIIGMLSRELTVCGSRQVKELKDPMSRSKKAKMAVEGLDVGANEVIAVCGVSTDLQLLVDIISQRPSSYLPIEAFNWVIEEGLVSAIPSEDLSKYENRVVCCIRHEDCIYPISNLDAVGACKVAGHRSVLASVIDYSELAVALRGFPNLKQASSLVPQITANYGEV